MKKYHLDTLWSFLTKVSFGFTKKTFRTIVIILKPLLAIKDNSLIFFLWFIFTVFAGQIGVISNIIIRHINGTHTLTEVIYLESISGSFYIYSIALLAATLGPLFVNMIEKPQTQFKSIKVVTIVFSIFTLLFASVFYTSTQPDKIEPNITTLAFVTDKWQLGFFIISITLSIYAYSVLRLEYNPDQYKDLDRFYAEKDDENVDKLTAESNSVTTDSKGNKL